MQHSLWGLVAPVALLTIGCGFLKPAPAPVVGPAVQKLAVHGVSYELPLAAEPEEPLQAARSHLKSITANGIKWTNGTHTLEVIDENMTLNGVKYGTVRRRDLVQLTADGVLSVNGETRARSAVD